MTKWQERAVDSYVFSLYGLCRVAYFFCVPASVPNLHVGIFVFREPARTRRYTGYFLFRINSLSVLIYLQMEFSVI